MKRLQEFVAAGLVPDWPRRSGRRAAGGPPRSRAPGGDAAAQRF
jgi:hypothetical protein